MSGETIPNGVHTEPTAGSPEEGQRNQERIHEMKQIEKERADKRLKEKRLIITKQEELVKKYFFLDRTQNWVLILGQVLENFGLIGSIFIEMCSKIVNIVFVYRFFVSSTIQIISKDIQFPEYDKNPTDPKERMTYWIFDICSFIMLSIESSVIFIGLSGIAITSLLCWFPSPISIKFRFYHIFYGLLSFSLIEWSFSVMSLGRIVNYIGVTIFQRVQKTGEEVWENVKKQKDEHPVIYYTSIFLLFLFALTGLILFCITMAIPIILMILGAFSVLLKTRNIYHHAFGVNFDQWGFNTWFSFFGFLNQMASASSLGQNDHTYKKSLLDSHDIRYWEPWIIVKYIFGVAFSIHILYCFILNPFSFLALIPAVIYWLFGPAHINLLGKIIYGVLIANLFIGSISFIVLGWAVFVPVIIVLYGHLVLLFNDLYYRWVTSYHDDRDAAVIILAKQPESLKGKDNPIGHVWNDLYKTVARLICWIWVLRVDSKKRLEYMFELERFRMVHRSATKNEEKKLGPLQLEEHQPTLQLADIEKLLTAKQGTEVLRNLPNKLRNAADSFNPQLQPDLRSDILREYHWENQKPESIQI